MNEAQPQKATHNWPKNNWANKSDEDMPGFLVAAQPSWHNTSDWERNCWNHVKSTRQKHRVCISRHGMKTKALDFESGENMNVISIFPLLRSIHTCALFSSHIIYLGMSAKCLRSVRCQEKLVDTVPSKGVTSFTKPRRLSTKLLHID